MGRRSGASSVAMIGLCGCVNAQEVQTGCGPLPEGVEAAAPPETTPSNVLLIVLDDVGPELIGSYGVQPDAPPTPHIDALAAEGVRFTHAWQDPWCSPSRAMMMTGRHARRYGIGRAIEPFTGDTMLPAEEVTIAELLRDESPWDVQRALIGKWHLSSGSGGLDAPRESGFDHFSGTLANLDRKHAFDGKNQTYFDWEHIQDGVLERQQGYITSATVDDVLAWTSVTSEPWFLWVGFHSAHTPWHSPPTDLQTYGDVSEEDTPTKVRVMVQAMDTEIGRLLEGLGPEVRARTNVIVVGDNGTTIEAGVGEFAGQMGKSTVLEHGLRVPLIVRGPAVIDGGRAVDALVQGTDLYRTLAELGGVDLTNVGLTLDSVSLLPYLRDAATPPAPKLDLRRGLRAERRSQREREGRARRDGRSVQAVEAQRRGVVHRAGGSPAGVAGPARDSAARATGVPRARRRA